MKTFRFIGMALFAILMCVNFASCSSSDDDPTEGPEEGDVVVSGKKLTKITGTYDGEVETYSFNYDNNGRVIKAEYKEDNYTETYQFIWGDDAIRVSWTYTGSTSNYSCTLSLKNGLVQHEDYGEALKGTFSYNSSNKLARFTDGEDWTVSTIWDGDKLVSISNEDADATLTYENKSCKKGYFPFLASMIEPGESYILYMAHPEIAGMRTNQLPTNLTWTDNYGSETSTFTYEFDKEGYISKIVGEETFNGSTETYTYTLTWE